MRWIEMNSLDIEEENSIYNLLYEKECISYTTQSQKVSSEFNYCVILYHQSLLKTPSVDVHA